MNPVPVYSHQTANTWIEIPQVGGARPVNKTGKRRLVMTAVRFWSMTGLAVASLIIGYMALRMWRDNPGGLAGPSESVPLREIVMRSDGVLDLAWVKQTLAVKPGVGIMSLDLTELQDRLMASGQVRTAVISRRFPDVLAVVMEERSPVLRVQSQGDESARAALFVARDGTVFSGENYDEALVSSLPWLDGVSLVRAASGRGFARIDGLVPVSDLLGTARSAAPGLARSFQRVSLARFARDRVVIVGTPDVPEIVFGTHAELGFFQQLARLDYILDELRAQPGGKVVRSINLSLGGRQVPVAFEPAAPASPKSSRSSAVPSAAVSRVGQAGPSSNPYTFFRL
jgi:hypothetical protein